MMRSIVARSVEMPIDRGAGNKCADHAANGLDRHAIRPGRRHAESEMFVAGGLQASDDDSARPACAPSR
jgi:hypothetical protein